MFKKDYLYAGVIGLITAFFGRLLLINNEVTLAYGGFSLPLWSLFAILPIAEFIAYIIASKLFSHILFLKQLGRFGIVGLMNVCVDIGIATTLRRAYGIDPLNTIDMLPILIVASSIAIVNSYFWQRMWTFAEKAPPTRKGFLVFVIVTLIGLGLNTVVSVAIIQGVGALSALSADRILTISKIAATAISLFWNFLGYKFIVFKE
ncbi:MAG: GtrA family protein [Candidatus Ryanbacteria bacterium]|nr:GtrA family protein [Candidatus Ryanbacteria bacterium]